MTELRRLQAIQGAFRPAAALPEHVRVDHGGRDVAMAQEFLDGPDVRSPLKEGGCETVAKRVRTGAFGNPHPRQRRFDGLVNCCLVQVVPPGHPGTRIGG